jgi:hypothetical protein
LKISSEGLEKPGKHGGRSQRRPWMIGFRRHSAQGFLVSKIYYSYRLEDKNYTITAEKTGIYA